MVVVPLIWIRETWEELLIVQLNAYLQAWLAPYEKLMDAAQATGRVN
jgi:hypothetical protein